MIYPESKIWTSTLDSLQKISASFNKVDFETYVFYSPSAVRTFRTSRDSIEVKKDTTAETRQILKYAHTEGNNLTFIEYDPVVVKNYPIRFFDFCLIEKNGDVRFLGPQSSQVFFERLKQDISELIKKK
jgi:hypothetical protein